MKRLVASEELKYDSALKYFSKETIEKAIAHISGYALQDDDAFCELAKTKKPEEITIEDMLNFAANHDNYTRDIVSSLLNYGGADFGKTGDYATAYERAKDQSYDVMSIVEEAIKRSPGLEKKLKADLKVAYSLYEHDVVKEENQNGISDARYLVDDGDKVGDTIELSKSFDVDLGNRDTPFIYLRGEVITGNRQDTHSDLINKYFETARVDRKMVRSLDAVDELEAGEPVAFGHIAKNMAFIQTMENCTVDEVKNALQKSGNYKKIYDYNFENCSIKRLAKEELLNVNELIEKENCKKKVIDFIADNIDMVFGTGTGKNAEKVKSIYDSKNDLSIVDLYDLFDSMINGSGLGDMLLSDLNLDSQYYCGNNFSASIKSFVGENENDATFAKAVSKVKNAFDSSEKENNSDESSSINNAEDLLEYDDKVGDVTKTTSKFNIDGTHRDYPYLYINGEVIFGMNSGETHTTLLNRYFETNDYGNERVRSIKQVKELEGNEPCSFGHIAKNMAFIQTIENCTEEEVVNALHKADSGLEKIYNYQFSKSQVKRLAKLTELLEKYN